MAVAMTRQTHTAAQLRELAASCADARASRRMLAIALVWEGVPRWKAAQSCGMDRQTVRDWIHRFNAEGVAGLCDRPHGGGPAGKLNPAQQAAFVDWVETGPEPKHDKVVRWRQRDLRDKLAEQFGVHLHERSVGKLLRRLGFRHVSVRPLLSNRVYRDYKAVVDACCDAWNTLLNQPGLIASITTRSWAKTVSA